MISTDYVGRIVLSTSGRDEGKYFIVVGVISEDYVYISDGDLRPVEKPKKKKIKHISFTGNTSENIKNLLQKGDKVNNSAIKKYLQSMNSNEEV